MKINIIRKITSRKFLVALITLVAGVVTMVVGDNETVSVIAGAAMTIVPTVAYCIVEGKIDAKSLETITDATKDAAEKLGADDSVVDVIEQMGAVGGVLVEEETAE
jgi:hypothetical protein